MKVEQLIEVLKELPLDADVQKVNLNDDTGSSDCEMTKEDWAIAENVKDGQGNPINRKIVVCTFGDVEE